MRVLPTVCMAMIVLTLGSLATGAEKDNKTQEKVKEQGTVHSVNASVQQSAGFIQAELVPGLFTVRKGFKAGNLKFSYHNPKSGTTLTKLNGKNIFSVTEHRYMEELNGNPNFELSPGDYKFVVGGDPGASGSLSYTTLPSKGGDSTTKTRPPKDTTKDTSKDKSKTGTEPDPLHPGGEGKRKVAVDLGAGKLDAWLTIDGNKLTLDFILPVFEGHLNVVKNTWRWEATLEKKAKVTTASGKTNYESNSIYKHGHNTRFTITGTFTATLEGNVLTGSYKEQTAWASDGVPPATRREGQWRIEGFTP